MKQADAESAPERGDAAAARADPGAPNAARDAGRTRIKICGVRTAEAVEAAARAGADAVGFVFARGSPRKLDAVAARPLAARLPPWLIAVSVFADAEPATIARLAVGEWVQLHGRTDLDAPELRSLRIIRALGIDAGRDAILREHDHPRVAALLVDAPRPGAGVAFDLAPLAALRERIEKPLLLAGGLSESTVGAAITAVRPWAVDVSSGVERERGTKDLGLIAGFCAAVRAAAVERPARASEWMSERVSDPVIG
ncbi:MAG TPA: phosphoribosylanthranilate isomerase [Phycisphaerales bacterium]|nr:phosphoribosylanthranilate isomerase [Phycisphaerales bacterium]HMP38385.1 phosphoribosylanthranilate isomerase [Phycisphaerales bacterium]